jgi:hypothetical protein
LVPKFFIAAAESAFFYGPFYGWAVFCRKATQTPGKRKAGLQGVALDKHRFGKPVKTSEKARLQL